MYNKINQDKFNGELPTPIITVQSTPRAHGHCSMYQIWMRKQDGAYELNIAMERLGEPIEEIIKTLMHEMIHIYCREKEIKETSRGTQYHNKKFKEEAERIGMTCEYTGTTYGWNTITSNMELEYAIKNEWSEFKIQRTISRKIGFSGGPESDPDSSPAAEEKKGESHIRKYQCTICGNSVRASKKLKVICGECFKLMEEK